MPHWVWSGLIGGLIATVISHYATQIAHRIPAEHGDGWRYSVYGWFYKSVVISCLPIVAFITYGALHAREDQRDIAAVVAGTMCAGAALLIYDVFVRRIRFNRDEIQSIHPFAIRRIAWANIGSVSYHDWLMMVRIRDQDGRSIWVSAVAGGSALLMRFLRRKHYLDSLRDQYGMSEIAPKSLPPAPLGRESETYRDS